MPSARSANGPRCARGRAHLTADGHPAASAQVDYCFRVKAEASAASM
jgi:hypothetical protein